MSRGAVTKTTSKMIPFWVPKQLLLSLDEAVKEADLDRSKFIRQAIREKLERAGIASTSNAS